MNGNGLRHPPAGLLKLISDMLHVSKGNLPGAKLLHGQFKLLAEWSDWDLVLCRVDGEVGLRFSAGLNREGDEFTFLPSLEASAEGESGSCAEADDLLSAIHRLQSRGKRKIRGAFSQRGSFWTNKAGAFLMQHGELVKSYFRGLSIAPAGFPDEGETSSVGSHGCDPDAVISRESDEWTALPSVLGAVGACEAIAILCAKVKGAFPLCLLFGWRGSKRLDARTVRLLEYSLEALSIALEHWWLAWSLEERVKELTCLHAMASQTDFGDGTLDGFLSQAVEIIPEAWLHRDVATARITFDGKSYATDGFSAGKQKLTSEILVGGQKRGLIEVAYTVAMPDLHEGPFLKEERKLLDAIARELSLRIEKKLGEEEKLRIKEQLRHSNRLAVIGQLAAAVAHELNEPLTSILGFSQLAAKSPNLPDQVSQDLEKIVAISLHAREIVRKLLVYGKKMPERRFPVDINRTVRDVVGLFEHHMAGAGIQLKLRLCEGNADIIADTAQMRQVVANLVLNAIQAMPEGGTLTISTDCTDESLLMKIGDTGHGMTPDVQEKIFIPFFTTKSARHGTGLGLPVAQEIVLGLGGRMQVESAPDAGTSFEIRLPLARAPSVVDELTVGRKR